MRRPLIALAAATATSAATLVLAAPPAQAVDRIDTQRLRETVTVGGILGHARVLQRIANEHGGTRASGTPGFYRSAEYVEQRLLAAGYETRSQYFTFPYFQELVPPALSQVSPVATDYDTATLQYSGSGDVTGQLVPTEDIVIPPSDTVSSSSGCEPADFVAASDSAPQVALIQRGTCTFEQKAANAQAAGYDAVVIFNEGQEGRQELLNGTLGRTFTLPVVGVSFQDGQRLYDAARSGAVTVRVTTSTENRTATTRNVIAETPGGDRDKVVVVGAHLDSVQEGPGINDNGSGTGAVLEIAEQMAELEITPRQKVRFAFWGAEENGLLGSKHYVAGLSDDQLGRIYANLNFDMLGSPNFARFVYDGDGSSGASEPGPPGSAQIERVFTRYFRGQDLASEPTPFNGRSDYGPFIAVGIPAGGLFSGAEGVKTAAQARRYGGTAGEAYDSCYHEACDTINNVSTRGLAELGDAAAHATLTLALTRSGLFEDGSLRVQQAPAQRQVDHRGSQAVR